MSKLMSLLKLKDKFEDIFKRQRDFQIKLKGNLGIYLTRGKQVETSTDNDVLLNFKQEITKETVLQLFSEVNEVLNEINWKHHADKKEVDISKIKEEIIDIQHFVINLALLWGMDYKEFYDIFVNKNNKNYERFINGKSKQ